MSWLKIFSNDVYILTQVCISFWEIQSEILLLRSFAWGGSCFFILFFIIICLFLFGFFFMKGEQYGFLTHVHIIFNSFPAQLGVCYVGFWIAFSTSVFIQKVLWDNCLERWDFQYFCFMTARWGWLHLKTRTRNSFLSLSC